MNNKEIVNVTELGSRVSASCKAQGNQLFYYIKKSFEKSKHKKEVSIYKD